MMTVIRLLGQAFADAARAEELHFEAAYRAQLRKDALALFRHEDERLPRRVELAMSDLRPKSMALNITWEAAQEQISL